MIWRGQGENRRTNQRRDRTARRKFMRGSHANRTATKAEMRSATQVIKQAFPNYDVVWGGRAGEAEVAKRKGTCSATAH